MKTVNEMTEAEMREAKVPTSQTPEELAGYISALVDRQHDYVTCVYAMSMAATAAFNYVAHKLGVSGFQASCADLDILARTRDLHFGKILDYRNLLYPQYCDTEHFPGVTELMADEKIRKWLGDEARKKLTETNGVAHPNVLAHWQKLASQADGEAK